VRRDLVAVPVALAGIFVILLGGASCASRRNKRQESVQHLSAEALYGRATQEIAQRDLRKARLDLERVQFTAENRPKLEPLVRLSLADATFYGGDDISLIEARSKYLDFVTLYGDHKKAPYAQFQAGVCSLRQARDPSKDQAQTQTAIADFREVRRRFPDSPYAHAAAEMIDEAEKSMAEHEFLVGYFYYKRKAYTAATERFRGVMEQYPRYREREKLYFYMGQALIAGNNDAEGRIYLDKLLTDYPDSEYAEEAKKILASGPTEAKNKTNGKS
jgi:outer membrane protein assembly factor BamD